MQASLLIYDIPMVRRFRNRDRGATMVPVCPNPSGALWAHGCVRVNLSCWVVPTHRIPWILLNQLREAGVNWHTVPFADDAIETLRTMVTEAVSRELAERMGSVRQTADAALTEDDPACVAYRKRVADALKRAETLFGDLKKAAEQFGVSLSSLADARNQLFAIKSASNRRAAEYTLAIRQLRETGSTDANGIANAMESYDVNPLIAADMLDDAGADGSTLRETFRD